MEITTKPPSSSGGMNTEEKKASYLDMGFTQTSEQADHQQIIEPREDYSVGLALDSDDEGEEAAEDMRRESYMAAISDTESSSVSSSSACASPSCAHAKAANCSSNSPIKLKKEGRLPRLKRRLGLSRSLTSLTEAIAAKQTKEKVATTCGCHHQAPEVTSSPPVAPKKSALRKSSSYGCLEPCCQVIPINTKSKAWKQLPAPRDIPCFDKMVAEELLKQQHPTEVELPQQLYYMDASSHSGGSSRSGAYSALFGPPQTDASTKRRQSSNRRRRSKGVAFSAVHVREHDLTVGDNPSCGFGAPVSLDWTYEQQPAVPIDFFEFARRSQRRTYRDLRLGADRREEILLHYDIPITEIIKADMEKDKIRRQRDYTREVSILVPTSLQVLVESAIRKVKRTVSSSSRV